MKKLSFLFLTALIFTGCSFLFPKEDEMYVVKVIVDSNVTVTPMSAKVLKGENVTFTYSLKEGYVLSGISVNGVNVAPSSNTFSIVVNSPDQTVKVSTKEKEKPKFIISATAGPNGTVSPYGDIMVTEGQDQTINILPNVGYLISTLKVDNTFVSPTNLYIFSNVSSNGNLMATYKKDSILWPLLNIIWKNDSTYIDQYKWDEPDGETLNYSSDGNYIKVRLGVSYDTNKWTLDKKTSAIIYDGRLCKIELINEKKFIFSYTNGANQKVTKIYKNNGYK